jgi:hypothetical protein
MEKFKLKWPFYIYLFIYLLLDKLMNNQILCFHILVTAHPVELALLLLEDVL